MTAPRALRADLIDRAEAAFLPSDQCVPERASPWWHGSAVASPGARVLIAVRGKRGVVWHWARAVAALGERLCVVIQTAGPADHEVLPGQSLQINPSLHAHIVLPTQADVRALEAWRREQVREEARAC